MISVIIPTYNRRKKLAETLDSLEEQVLDKKDFEVIVVDDGSVDGTSDFLSVFKKKTSLNFAYFRQENSGAGQARNLGVSQAKGLIVFFCGDDTFLDKNLLLIHRARHQRRKNIAVLGMTDWNDSEKINDFMKYIAPAGPQFHYNTIKDKENARFSHFYTCNISLEKKWFDLEKFDPIFVHTAFEDIDLGLRLEKRGLRIIFEPLARAFHFHYYEPEMFYQRMLRVGWSIVAFLDKFKQDKKSCWLLKWQYAPFSFGGLAGVKIFNSASYWLAKSNLLKRINLRYHWFWSICYYYSQGILEELARRKNV